MNDHYNMRKTAIEFILVLIGIVIFAMVCGALLLHVT